MHYRARVVDGELAESLVGAGAVVVEGPRACGKTETARQQSRSEVNLDIDPNARQAVSIDPSIVLAGLVPRLIDEWQLELTVWDHVRREVDRRQTKGQFILTGSAVPRDNVRRHTGAGRFVHLRMRPMTLAEVGHSSEKVSLAAVLSGQTVTCPDPGLSIPDLAERLAIGGWPGHLGLNATRAQRLLKGYIEDTCNIDVPMLDRPRGAGVRRDPRSIMRLVRALARNVACPVTVGSLTADANGSDGNMKEDTVRRYLDALSRLMFTDDVEAWSPSIRSRIRLRTSSVRHLADPSLALVALGSSPARLMNDLNWFGYLFESLVVRDLRVYAQALSGQVRHYRDDSGLEVDSIVDLPDGSWAAFEVKLGSTPEVVDAAAANLLALRQKVVAPPTALGVITGAGHGFARKDGVLQIPIGALCP